MIRKAFGDNVLLLPLPDDGNHVVFAFRDAAFEPRWRWIGEQAKALGTRFGLDLDALAAKLERSRKLGLARRGLDDAPEPGRRRLL
jgi:spermidine synthase